MSTLILLLLLFHTSQIYKVCDRLFLPELFMYAVTITPTLTPTVRMKLLAASLIAQTVNLGELYSGQFFLAITTVKDIWLHWALLRATKYKRKPGFSDIYL